MSFSVIIPARYQSQRLPGKPLLDIHGKPMIQRVYEQAAKSAAIRVVVATDDQRVVDAVQGFDGEVCLTSTAHPSGTDRLQEVCHKLGFTDDQVVVNVQGDEPLIPPAVINQVANNLHQSAAEIATLYEEIDQIDDIHDPNIVKVVTNNQSMAVYFSRAAIPFARDEQDVCNVIYKRHLGIYAYRVSFLNKFVDWMPVAMEETEKLEQLRALWHGVDIHVDQSIESIPPGVDTDKDLQRTLRVLKGNK